MNLFSKILIANRGEIAVRIIKTAQKMGIPTVVVYSEEEQDALHVRMADEAVELQGNTLSETYLNISLIISVAKKVNATAIHPGYGFLSENEDFASACEKAGITFIGPRSETIALMGNKTKAREAAVNAGLPVTEGYYGDDGELLLKGIKMDFPLLIKAAAGGGGKGMRIVSSPEKLADAIAATSREAMTYFGNGSVYIEKYLQNPRHIEIQILSDNYGNTIHLFERECSIQRRYQKIIEESPSPSISAETRNAMGEAAVKLAKAIDYRNAGTIEFLADNSGNFFFLEMNTRIQVEHPVTESVTGIDIVEEQILIAAGSRLRYSQDYIKLEGHAIECRIYAEDPVAGFLPSPGKMTCYAEPVSQGIRVDSAYDHAQKISGNYDPMISKLISTGRNRNEARERAVAALENYAIHGVKNNISFLISLLHNRDFISANFSTSWCENHSDGIIEDEQRIKMENNWKIPAIGVLLASLQKKTGRKNIWERIGYWRTGRSLKFCFEGETVEAEIKSISANRYELMINNEEFNGKYQIENNKISVLFKDSYHDVFASEDNEGHFQVTYRGSGYFFRRFDLLKNKDFFTSSGSSPASGTGAVFSPMPGRVIKVNKLAGDLVKQGEVLVIVESMKMENSIHAPEDGTIQNIDVKEGQLIDSSMPLLLLNHYYKDR